ncbi:MAG: 50S ribosomal protein L25 [Desulfovibrionaceae bacterium]
MAKKKLETLTVQKRTATGKGPNRRLRVQGVVPAVYYDQHGTNILVQVAELPLSKLYAKVGTTQVFNLSIGEGEDLPCMIWRLRNEPVTGRAEHVDFFGVDLNKTLRVSVPFTFTGTAKGVASEGGMLSIFRDSIEVTCKPLDIPEHIEIDVTELGFNDHIQAEDLQLPEGVEAHFEENFAIVAVTAMDDGSAETSEEGGEEEEEAAEEE